MPNIELKPSEVYEISKYLKIVGKLIGVNVECSPIANVDHAVVNRFWDIYEKIGDSELNHSNSSNKIAINLLEFIDKAKAANLQTPSIMDLRMHLKKSIKRKLIKSNWPTSSRHSVDGRRKTLRCWIFEKEDI